MTSVRNAAVAGMFYPGDQQELATAVRLYLEQAESDSQAPAAAVPKAIIAPHAGYVYSGALAARAYARLKPARDIIRRVVILGPCHRVAVRGLALSGADTFATPLGQVRVDKIAAKAILDLPQVEVFDETHAQEHSLEVHLPFLQEVLDDFYIVPLVVGDASGEEIAQVLERLWGGPETVFVISSDLSHYLDYDAARTLDGDTCRAIESLDPDAIGREQACGRIPIRGLLTLAKRRGLRVTTLGLCNSGDTAGTKDRVVGYGSWMFMEPGADKAAQSPAKGENAGQDADAFETQTRALLDAHGESLLRLAAASLKHGLANGAPLAVNPGAYPKALRQPGACFVTLKKDGKLRGCIGSPEAFRPLVVDVAERAFDAGFKDSRFGPVEANEVADLDLSISVLSPAAPMTIKDEADLLGQLRPGTDGLIIEDGGKRALFLPSVWESLAEPAQFLAHLKHKAGLAVDHWSRGFRAQRFIAGEVSSKDLDGAEAFWGA